MTKWLGWGRRLLREPLLRFYHNFTVRRLIWVLVFIVATTLLLGFDVLPKHSSLEAGQPSPRDYLAPQSITYESQVLTEQAKSQVTSQVEPLYRIDNQALSDMEKEVDKVLLKVQETIEEGPSSVASGLRSILGYEIGLSTAEALVAAGENGRSSLGDQLKEKLRLTMGRGVGEQELSTTRSLLLQQVAEMDVSSQLKSFARSLISNLELRPTLVNDVEGTMLRLQEIRDSVQPIQVTVRSGEKIVGKGELITAQNIEALQRLGLLRPVSSLLSFLGILLLVGLFYILLGFYIRVYRREFSQKEGHLILLGLLLVLCVALGRALTAIELGGQPEGASMVGYMIPVAASSMLIAILLDSRLAIFSTIIMGLLIGVLTGGQLAFTVVGIAGGLAGVYSVSRLSQRTGLAKASLYIMLADVAAISGMILIQGEAVSTIALGLIMGVVNGVFSSVLTIGSLPFLESAFGLTSAVKLLELANPNQPLLRKLLLEAPGTYHHSVMVANLAEAAANILGADALLARVASLYHDIGKIRRPCFFIENQLNTGNPHDKLSPNLSTLIITSHIKDGLEMARDGNLPPVITDIIAQHHGSSLVSYFYHKATEKEQGKPVAEEGFRYDSPKPRSREAAIVMLADSVEAGARSVQKPSPVRLEGLVHKIIKEKLDDGQLEECALTFQDLDKIGQAFTRSLSGFFHSRIEYPDVVVKEIERRKARDAVSRKQSTG